jgi:hypothetical protein
MHLAERVQPIRAGLETGASARARSAVRRGMGNCGIGKAFAILIVKL